jgi:ubiquinone/menaquinone biosynthesis C-methylase UbiE
MENIEFTGERYLPMIKGEIKYEHLHRYALCLSLVKDKQVLDIASGEGYGSSILAKEAKSVLGVDIDIDAIKTAQSKYEKQDNLKFLVGSCESIPLAKNSVEIVTSFETIEHHDKHHEMMKEIKRVIKQDGTLIISSPNREVYSDKSNGTNPFHIKELYYKEFKVLLSQYFKYVNIYGQRLATGSVISPIQGTLLSNYIAYTGEAETLKSQVAVLSSPVYFVAICSDRQISINLRLESLYLNEQDDLYVNAESELTCLKAELSRLNEIRGFIEKSKFYKIWKYWFSIKQKLISKESKT